MFTIHHLGRVFKMLIIFRFHLDRVLNSLTTQRPRKIKRHHLGKPLLPKMYEFPKKEEKTPKSILHCIGRGVGRWGMELFVWLFFLVRFFLLLVWCPFALLFVWIYLTLRRSGSWAVGDGGSLLLDKAQRMLVTSSGSFMCCNTCLFVCLSICLISNFMPKVCCPCLPKQMNFRKCFKQTGKSLSCVTGGQTMWKSEKAPE